MDETTTQTAAVPLKRIAIVGTAPTWKNTPWHDTGLDIASLNDAYLLGFPRATHWFDLHPFHQMCFRPPQQRIVGPFETPVGAYLRPQGHLDWLKSRPHPVYLRTAHPDWPTSRTFPRAAIETKFGPYFSSTPAWMLAWAMEEGYQEIHIYGIHLATQWEYTQQRPNLEFLIGVALARGIRVVIPERSPLLKSTFSYAYDAKPEIPQDRVQRRIDLIKAQGQRLHQQLAGLPWYAARQRADGQARLAVVNLELLDAQQELQRLTIARHVA